MKAYLALALKRPLQDLRHVAGCIFVYKYDRLQMLEVHSTCYRFRNRYADLNTWSELAGTHYSRLATEGTLGVPSWLGSGWQKLMIIGVS